ncbi:MAG: AAC(3) family N-acetyltransferase [Gemmatimonadetes bacterium]|jgi:aminoglycoside 3-N-acetyltransferase|nr:AAC(3) family N-acetyltransferase [Gemmatimonadota bacterium]MBT5326360.1 AAC(3) family N-acetyltransferase [Gemmatimonadota bacterium]MBT5447924.1 AAC(3) family N-acetyltransferase [Gemmatimonadota bacterium]MBT5804201.1 AAC(3) family N-acetyltransferase [Gemmatimonadota bacterium]MBT6621059.1 AAC(3) family N-acetyltransferase [Gemmatimonadota bacterium]
MGMTATQVSLCADLCRLGVEPGDILFIHSSFKSLGPVDGGAETVVRALEDAVGSAGLILMPSFQLVPSERDQRAAGWDWATTPSTVGWLTEYFRRMPDTVRSDHYSHSVAARGGRAADVVAGHLSRAGFSSPWDRAPWGKTYGFHSPMYRAYVAAGKLLMLGVDYETSTYVHLVETLYWQRCRSQDPEVSYKGLNRLKLGTWWDETGDLARGRLAQAECRLFNIRTYVNALLGEVSRNPDPYL